MRMFVSLALALAVALQAVPALGEGYRTHVGEGGDRIPVVVLKGTPYEMGYAFGSLMKEETQKVLKGFVMMAKGSGEERYSDETLDAAWESVSPHTSDRFKEELRGIAEGSGLELTDVIRAHMIPVVSDYSCSGVAAWGEATQSDHLYQIRNLDYNTRAGLQDFPVLAIYIPNEGIPHVSPTFAGCAGANTGMNFEGISLTEIGDTPGRDYPFNLDGEHFTTMFRDILYDCDSLDSAVNRIKEAKRIKKYHYFVGDGDAKKAVKMKAHAPDLIIWGDNDATDELAPNILQNIVYHCEGRDPLGWAALNEFNGNIGPEQMVEVSRRVATKGGNLLNVVYDATARELWVAYAEKDENAYLRPYVHVKMNDYIPYKPKGDEEQILTSDASFKN